MGNYITKKEEDLKVSQKEKVLNIFVKVNGFDYEYKYEYGNVMVPYSGKLGFGGKVNSYNNEVEVIIKALENISENYDEIIVHCSKISLNHISNILYHQTDPRIIILLSDKNIRFVDL